MLGATDPDITLGNPNDLYLNSVTGDLFKKDTTNIWVKKGNLKGPAGLNGKDGTDGKDGTNGTNGKDGASFDVTQNFNTGPGLPPATANLFGLYLDTTTGDLYSVIPGQPPKFIMNLKGPAGTPGTNGGLGTTGAQGLPGTPGTPGAAGEQLLNGVGSPAKELGNIQDVYVDTITGDFYRKTDATTWTLFYSIGSKTPQPSSGSGNFSCGNGAPTDQTLAIGAVYLDLLTCTFYHRDSSGTIQILFQKGSPIVSGKGEPLVSLGNLGDIYLDTDSHNLYQKVDGKSWTLLMNLNGAPGKDGTNGINGTNGTDGNNGTTTIVKVPAPPAVLLNLDDAQLNFAHNKSDVSDESFIKLTKTGKALQKYSSSIKEIEIKGETDRTGTAAYNKKLAQARADSVAKVLIHTGLESRKVDAFGLDMPQVSSCATDDCAADRWVNIGIDLIDSLTLDQRNEIISDLNREFGEIWK